MVQKIFYNASLPRAGSTLLQNIMMQNPEIYSTPTSGVVEFLLSARSIYTTGDAFKAQDPELMEKGFKGFCREGMYGFFNAVTDRPYVIDKSRAWMGHFSFADWFDEKPKVLCMVRDLRSVFTSMEKNYRKNPHKDPQIVNGIELKNMTTTSRLDHYSVSPPIGPSIEWLYEAIHQGYDKNICFVKFEDLTTNPEKELKRIYNYLELPYYNHDFNNVEQMTIENDVIHGIFGDHKIERQIRPVKENYNEILGKDNADRLRMHYDWFYKRFNYV